MIEDEAVRNKAENDSAIRISIKTNKKTPLVESLMRNINTLPTKLDIKSHQYNDQSRQQTVIEQVRITLNLSFLLNGGHKREVSIF